MIHNEITQYISECNALYKAGNATEHSYRPALKTLLETMMPQHTATNEPKRIACGAHYQKIIWVLKETERVMREIDEERKNKGKENTL